MVYLCVAELSRLLDADLTMAEIEPLMDYCNNNRTHVLHTCPIIDTYYITPELSITYVPVLKESESIKVIQN